MAESPAEEALNIASQSDAYSSNEDSKEVEKTMNELLDAVAEGKVYERDSAEISPTDISSFVEMEDSSIFKENDIYENMESFSKLRISKPTGRSRSISENESESDANPQSIGRRKFGSEGAIFSASKNVFPPVKQRELSEAVEQYIEKLIKESIFKAVRSVNVDNLCEDILKNISSRQNSIIEEPENDFIVEQRLHSDSITELIEMERDFSSIREKSVEVNGDLQISDRTRDNAKESLENEIDDSASFGGYLADLEDTASLEDLKSAEESLNSSMSSALDHKFISRTTSNENTEKPPENVDQIECTQTLEVQSSSKDTKMVSVENTDDSAPETGDSLSNECPSEVNYDQQQKLESPNSIHPLKEKETSDVSKHPKVEQNFESQETLCKQEEISLSGNHPVLDEIPPSPRKEEGVSEKLPSSENIDGTVHLIETSLKENLLSETDSKTEENPIPAVDQINNPPQHNEPSEDQTKVNWKVGYLHVKLPHKSRGKTHLKAWKKRRVIIQPDEFVNDPKNPSLVISVYGSDSKKHAFWYSVSSQRAVVFRSSSRTHRYAFTISEGGQPIIHLSSDRETTSQEWMAAIRSVLWPPSPFMELEKMLNGREFEISIIDNEYSYHAGLLGMYGYLSITPKKLILLHPQQGYVIQEWYLNTVDKFQFVPQPKVEDDHKVLCMTTCNDSSTGKGDLIIFCNEAVTLLQSLASNIHEVLSLRSKEEGGRYRKELEEIAEWLVAPPQDCLNVDPTTDEHYKVPPRQVKSLLDIPNFIFNQALSPVASAVYPAPSSNILEPLDGTKNKPMTTSNDSGISTSTSGDDFLNCSFASFIIGGGPFTGKSSDSELSDAYTPPRTPEVKKKNRCDVLKEEQVNTGEV